MHKKKAHMKEKEHESHEKHHSKHHSEHGKMAIKAKVAHKGKNK